MNKLTALLSVALVLLFLCNSCTIKKNTLSSETDTVLDTYWVLVSLEGQNVQAPQDTRTAYIRLQENEDDVTGYTGCNRLFGKYTLTEQRLELSDLSTPRVACPDMQTENKMLDVLRRVDSYRVAGDLLNLYDGETVVATFMTGNVHIIEQEIGRGRTNENN